MTKTAIINPSSYIQEMKGFFNEFSAFPDITNLISSIIEADKALANGELPPDLPQLLLPNNIQDQIFAKVNSQYTPDDPKGDKIWDQFVNDLPRLDFYLRNFRDYLEEKYGMWCYISENFASHFSNYLTEKTGLEIMAGNGYLSKGLRENGINMFTTDNFAWKNENETGKHTVTPVENLDANQAFEKYKNDISFVIMVWSPDHEEIDFQFLQKMRKENPEIKFFVIGEKYGATNSKKFWDNAHLISSKEIKKINQFLPHFDLIKDKLFQVK